MINIKGLTPLQAELCELLWNMDSMEEISQFLEHLDHRELCEAMAMMNLMLAEYLDTVDLGACSEAHAAIQRIQAL